MKGGNLADENKGAAIAAIIVGVFLILFSLFLLTERNTSHPIGFTLGFVLIGLGIGVLWMEGDDN